MKRFHPRALLLPANLLVLAISGCGPGASPTMAPTEAALVSPTVALTDVSIEVPAQLPAPTPAAAATTAPIREPVPSNPPTAASLGDTWVRPADEMVMVYVPAGEFEMGSDNPFYNNERPPHKVVLDGFWMDQTEVTNGQYQRCVEAGSCKPPAATASTSRQTYYGHDTYDNYPVIHVNWYRAVAYCQWVGGRLPTEEEWEYAARGPESNWFPWGNQADRTRLNYCDAGCFLDHADKGSDDGYADTAPVGSYLTGASWCGALDLLGNVWEWNWDWYGFYPDEDNPAWLPSSTTDRVIRGGAWDTSVEHVRCSYRSWLNPVKSHDSVGFRCVFSLPTEQTGSESG